jgi:NADH-quinone oxidoreductase subunit M
MQILCHGISTGALFILVGALMERTHTRDINRLGGLWATVLRMGGVAMVFALASLGLPGLGNFVGELLVLFGAYQVSPMLTILGTVGLVSATVYSLWLIQKVFHGPQQTEWKIADFSRREMAMMTALIASIVWLGLHPQPVLNTARPAIQYLQHLAGGSHDAE